VDILRVRCNDSLGAENASGVDGVSKAEYGKNLEDNLHKLPVQLKRTGSLPKEHINAVITVPLFPIYSCTIDIFLFHRLLNPISHLKYSYFRKKLTFIRTRYWQNQHLW
jgi:hypothetical protein